MTEHGNTTTATAEPQESLLDRSKGAFNDAGSAIRGAVDNVVGAARENPATAAAIAAGAAAAVAGAAYGVSKLREQSSSGSRANS